MTGTQLIAHGNFGGGNSVVGRTRPFRRPVLPNWQLPADGRTGSAELGVTDEVIQSSKQLKIKLPDLETLCWQRMAPGNAGGRPAAAVVTKNFTRLEAVANKSGRYYWKCNYCPENSAGARIEGAGRGSTTRPRWWRGSQW